MNKVFYSIIVFIACSFNSFSQTGEIQGKVTDDKGDAIPFAQVVVVDDAAGTRPSGKGAKADLNGRYTIKGLSPGKYNFMAKALGKPKSIETDVQILAGRPTTLDFKLEETSNIIAKDKVVVTTKRVNKTKLIDVFTPKENTMTAAEVKQNSVRDINSLAASTGQVTQEDRGAALNVAGGRSDGNIYIIDGVKINGGSTGLPPSAIAQLEVITSGVPAKYGDATGGVVNITTKGPSKEFHGSLEGITSQYLDPYGYNLLGGSLTGPLIRRKIQYDSFNPMPIGGEKQKGDVLLGFQVSGELQYDKDRFPTITGSYKVKDDVLKKLIDNPYSFTSIGSVQNNQSLLKASDLEHINAHQNTSGIQGRLNGKLDWKVNTNGTNITLGGRYTYDKYNDFIARYSLLNYENNYEHLKKSFNGYLRLYQPLFNSDKQVGKLIQNTTMQLQVDYSAQGEGFYSPFNKYDVWSYGYVGKFEEIQKGVATLMNGNGSDNTKVYYGSGVADYLDFSQFYQINSTTPDGIIYTPGTVNPNIADLTKKFLALVQGTDMAKSVNALSTAGATVNGSRADIFIQNLFFPYGRVAPVMQKQNNTQFRATGNFNFDIIPKSKSSDINKHTIEAGFELEKRINSQYNLQPSSLWQIAGNLVNSHLSVDVTHNYNPLLIMKDGTVKMRLQDYKKQLDSSSAIVFGAFDTVFYDNMVSSGDESTFGKNLRKSLNKSETDFININSLDPSQLNINMFSPNELLSGLGTAVGYYGYDIYGNASAANTSFNSFFKDKDANGNYTRQVGARMPFYAAGYIQDRFQLKDIAFNVGVRLDYYNSNQKVLIDPYVPQGVNTVADIGNKFGTVPSNISRDAAVYVNSIDNPTKIVGYREGSKWYDAKGLELSSAQYIINESGGQIQPYLAGATQADKDKRNMSNDNFNPDLIFTTANAVMNFMPRLNFSFKIDSNALFFAHYDVMAQRPVEDQNFSSALDYYNLIVKNVSTTGSPFKNPNLVSPKTADLELGFKQRLSQRSSLTLNFYYREYMNQIQVNKYQAAYPVEYISYSNDGFSTVKGFGLAYELRKMATNLSMKANYTMQFAEGTGSNSTSQLSLLNANQGNLKVIAPLNFDVRHTFNLNMDYRFASGSNYTGPMSLQNVLENFGVNLTSSLKSGLPYTLQSNITPEAFISSTARTVTLGDINSASMPWRYNFNIKIDKDFTMKVGKIKSKEAGLDTRKEVVLNAYLNIQNLLNTQNILSVYRYTGTAETDGYLSSPSGLLDYSSREAVSAGSGTSFRDLYNIAINLPTDRKSNYALPRTIWLGASLSF